MTYPASSIPSGYVGLAGPANTGKSSLLNSLSGRAISPVTGFPGTTRLPLTGLSLSNRAQICFIDTPPLKAGRDLDIFHWMDVLCLVLDCRKITEQLNDSNVQHLLDQTKCQVVLALTFPDYYPSELWKPLTRQTASYTMLTSVVMVCPPRGDGIPELRKNVISMLPYRSRIFPEKCTTLHSERFLVGEQIRKELFNILPTDIAAHTAVQIEEFSFRDGKTYVRANLHVARHLSKGIVIGKRGQTLQKIVEASTDSACRFLNKQIYLDLWVKVREAWPDNPKDLLEFGYVC